MSRGLVFPVVAFGGAICFQVVGGYLTRARQVDAVQGWLAGMLALVAWAAIVLGIAFLTTD